MPPVAARPNAAVFFAAAATLPLAPVAALCTIVVPALESLTPELLSPRSGLGGGAAFFAACCRLAVLAAAGLAGLIGRAGKGFSGDVAIPEGLTGERGRVRELCDLGDRTVEGWSGLALAREAVRVALVFAVAAVVFARFFAIGRSCD